ncbi:MAG: response regulator transcription factor [Rhodospirillaceae bacterium]|nr:response regulator transcription factor [Rhodospirillaceae bacterium]
MNDGTVFIVDDDEANRMLFSDIFSSIGIDHKCFSSAQSFLDEFHSEESGCILLDIRMPGMSGLELQRRLREDGVAHPIIIVTAHGDVSIAIEAMKAGAFDFMEKPIRNQQLIEITQRALRYGQEAIVERNHQNDLQSRIAALTPREREVFDQVVDGEPNKRIAFNLDISIKTVELHRAKVMQKMDARSLADLIRAAVTAQD